MRSNINEIKRILDNIRSILKQLKKYPGNVHYINKYKNSRIDFDKKFKTFFLQVQHMQNINIHLEKLKKVAMTLKDNAQYQNKLKSITIMKDLLDEIEVELHEFVPTQLKINSDLEKKLGSEFHNELNDLKLVFGRSGTCTAFLLRKILEKCIFHTFVKINRVKMIEDKQSINKFVSLKSMIDIASREKFKRKPLLNSKTAKKLEGIKFLGDNSAHNFLVNVEMEDINPQMPYILIALKELTSVNIH